MPVYEEKEMIDRKKRYYIRTYIVDENGNKKQVTRHNKNWIGQDGKIKAQQEEIRLHNTKFIAEKKKQMVTLLKLEDLYLQYINNTVDKDTLLSIKNKLNHFCQVDKSGQVSTSPFSLVNNYTKFAYKKWQDEMKEKEYTTNKYATQKFKYSIRYLNRVHNEICRMIDFAINEGYCTYNFARQCGNIGTPKEVKISKTKKKYVVITYEQFLSLLSASENNLKYNTYFTLAFTRGPRPGEVRAFRCKDFDYEKKQLMVNHTMSKKNELKEPKTAASKAPIDLDDSLLDKINCLINELKKQDGYNDDWFIFNGKTPISSHALDYAKNKYFKLAGIEAPNFVLHSFRHSCATWLHSMGIPITVISKVLRHANIKETMQTYTHLFNEDYDKYLSLIDKVFAKQDQKQDQKK